MSRGDSSKQPHPARREILAFYALVPEGRDSALTAGELALRLRRKNDENGKRHVRALAEAAVVHHRLLVCADNSGYFKPANIAEADDYLARNESQIRITARRLKIIRNLLDEKFRASTLHQATQPGLPGLQVTNP